jgi:hypothetical protein
LGDTRCAVREDDAWELLAYLTASAELCTREPHYYGTFRLIDAASRLMGFMLASSASGNQWLAEFKHEVDEKKLWMLRDRDRYFEFLNQVPATLADHMRPKTSP